MDTVLQETLHRLECERYVHVMGRWVRTTLIPRRMSSCILKLGTRGPEATDTYTVRNKNVNRGLGWGCCIITPQTVWSKPDTGCASPRMLITPLGPGLVQPLQAPGASPSPWGSSALTCRCDRHVPGPGVGGSIIFTPIFVSTYFTSHSPQARSPFSVDHDLRI